MRVRITQAGTRVVVVGKAERDASRLDRKCGRGACFDLMIDRLVPYRETAASVLAEFSLRANT
jgi:hypothetical protein